MCARASVLFLKRGTNVMVNMWHWGAISWNVSRLQYRAGEFVDMQHCELDFKWNVILFLLDGNGSKLTQVLYYYHFCCDVMSNSLISIVDRPHNQVMAGFFGTASFMKALSFLSLPYFTTRDDRIDFMEDIIFSSLYFMTHYSLRGFKAH